MPRPGNWNLEATTGAIEAQVVIPADTDYDGLLGATPVANSIPLTGNALVDGLTQGSSWIFSGPRVLTYAETTNAALPPPNDEWWNGSGGSWTAGQSAAFALALGAWSSVAKSRSSRWAAASTTRARPTSPSR